MSRVVKGFQVVNKSRVAKGRLQYTLHGRHYSDGIVSLSDCLSDWWFIWWYDVLIYCLNLELFGFVYDWKGKRSDLFRSSCDMMQRNMRLSCDHVICLSIGLSIFPSSQLFTQFQSPRSHPREPAQSRTHWTSLIINSVSSKSVSHGTCRSRSHWKSLITW